MGGKKKEDKTRYKKLKHSNLNLVEGDNIAALDILIAGLDSKMLLNEGIHGYKVINNGKHYLQLLYTVTNRNKFRCDNQAPEGVSDTKCNMDI